jgi:Arc/MetJ-type ribon-helix-helix transcriptional regulator
MMPPVAPRKLYNFLIDPELADGLKELKGRIGSSESELVRRAIRAYLEREGVRVRRADRKRASTRKRP